ncbi:hypothetical protein HDU77_006497 [Chytriomyces hyalinus]|nr:hypothetical protein HDU77_006497 [Chytriomyces hyalinus]
MSEFYEPGSSVLSTDRISRARAYDPCLAAMLNAPVDAVVLVAPGAAGIRSLKDMCVTVLSGLISNVESLAGLPLNLARCIRSNIRSMSRDTLVMFIRDFPDEFASANEHLVYRDYMIGTKLRQSLNDAWFADFLTALELSGTDFGDDLCLPVSRLEALELLDVSGTKITNSGIRTLSRILIHADKDVNTGLPLSGLKRLTHLNLSMCNKIDGGDLDTLLARFPALLAVGLSRIYLGYSNTLQNLNTKHGWECVSKQINVFPGFREGTYRTANFAVYEEPHVPDPIHTRGVARPDTFFGVEIQRRLKKQMDEYFPMRAYQLDDQVHNKALQSLNQEFSSIIHQGRRLCELDESRPLENDLYKVAVGSKTTEYRVNALNPWYMPVQPPKHLSNVHENKKLVQLLLDTETLSRVHLVRSKARRDLELKKFLQRPVNGSKETALALGRPALVEISKRCEKRMESAPCVIPMSSTKKPKLGLHPSQEFDDLIKDLSAKPKPSQTSAPPMNKGNRKMGSGTDKKLAKKQAMLSGSQPARVRATNKRRSNDFSSACADLIAKNEARELAQVPEAEMTTKALSRGETSRTRIESNSESESSNELSKLLNLGSRKPAIAKQTSDDIRRRPPTRDPIPSEATLQPRNVAFMNSRCYSKTSSPSNAPKSSRAPKTTKSAASSWNWDSEKTFIDILEDKPLPVQLVDDDFGEESFHVVTVNNQSDHAVRQMMGSSRDSQSVARRRDQCERKANQHKLAGPWMVQTSCEKSTDSTRVRPRKTSPVKNNILDDLLGTFDPYDREFSEHAPRYAKFGSTVTPRFAHYVAERSLSSLYSNDLQEQILETDARVPSSPTSPVPALEPTTADEIDEVESDFEVHFSSPDSSFDAENDEYDAYDNIAAKTENVTSIIDSFDVQLAISSLRGEELVEHVRKSISIGDALHGIVTDNQSQQRKSTEKNPFVKSEPLVASILSDVSDKVKIVSKLSEAEDLEKTNGGDFQRIQGPSQLEAITQAGDLLLVVPKCFQKPTETNTCESFHVHFMLDSCLDCEPLKFESASTAEVLSSTPLFKENDCLGDSLLEAYSGSQMLSEDGLAVDSVQISRHHAKTHSGGNDCHFCLASNATMFDESVVNLAIIPSAVVECATDAELTVLESSSEGGGDSSAVQNMSNSSDGYLVAGERSRLEMNPLPEHSLAVESEDQMHHQVQPNALEFGKSCSALLDTGDSTTSPALEAINTEAADKEAGAKIPKYELNGSHPVKESFRKSSSKFKNDRKENDFLHLHRKPPELQKHIAKIPVADCGLTLDADCSQLNLSEQLQNWSPLGPRSR